MQAFKYQKDGSTILNILQQFPKINPPYEITKKHALRKLNIMLLEFRAARNRSKAHGKSASKHHEASMYDISIEAKVGYRTFLLLSIDIIGLGLEFLSSSSGTYSKVHIHISVYYNELFLVCLSHIFLLYKSRCYTLMISVLNS